MAKTLNFNSVRRPTLNLVMKDEAQTQIRVTVPNQALIERLQAVTGELQDIVNDKSGASVEAVYDLSASLMSCNTEGLAVSAADLRDKYHLELEELIIFFSAYLDFINEVTSAKN